MNQSINTDSKNIKEPQQKYRLGTVSIKILGGLPNLPIPQSPPPPSCPSSDDELADSFVQLPTPRGVKVEPPSSQLTIGNSSSPGREIAVSSSKEIKDGLLSTELKTVNPTNPIK